MKSSYELDNEFDESFYEILNNRKKKAKNKTINKKNINDFVNYLFTIHLYSLDMNAENIIDLDKCQISALTGCEDFLSPELSKEFKDIYDDTENIEQKIYILGRMLWHIAYIYSQEQKNINFLNMMKNIIERIEDIENDE